jgi:Leucine-rich repeat (LRR) protein
LKSNLSILGRLPKLKELHLEGDHFVQIPSEISMLASLESLYLNNNQIQELPKEVFKLKKLKYIDVTNNRMPNILLDQYRDDLAPTIRIQF